MATSDFNSAGQLNQLEHDPDNHAKRVNNYVWNGSAWIRSGGAGLVPTADFDYIDVQQTSDTVETYVYKNGGSGGTTVQTVTVTYTDATKDNIDYVTWS